MGGRLPRPRYADPYRTYRRIAGLLPTFPDIHRIAEEVLLVNLTGQDLRLASDAAADREPVSLPSAGRATCRGIDAVNGLPEPTAGVLYLVARDVFTAAYDRQDVAVPGRTVNLLDGSGRAHVGLLMRAGFGRLPA